MARIDIDSMNVILTDNSHFRDYWSRERMTTWLVLEDNGTQDGGKIIAEFREKEHAEAFCAIKGWICCC